MAVKSALINVMEKAARKATPGLLHDFGEVEQLQVSTKGPADFVTTADLKAEEVLIDELGRARPDFGFLVEERGEIPGADPTHRWLVDPLDGTTNFLHGIPHFCISIALERIEGSAGKTKREITAGLVFDPLRNELFWGEKGVGAFVNDRRLRVSGRRKLAEAVIATGIPVQNRTPHDVFLRQLGAVMAVASGVLRQGAAALDMAYVAAGRYDGYWESGLKAWDIGAGILLVREAGGYVTEIEGGNGMLDSGSVLAASDLLHPEIAKVLKAATAGR
ncbi:MAG: inositol monophosphatase [Proteobacteria bacterium]|nr:inositol monophosphatase [Pseudomonadota bacterium]